MTGDRTSGGPGPASDASTDAATTARLLLRRPTEADVDAVWRIHSDPRTNLFNPAGPMTNPAGARIRLNDMLTDWRHYGRGYWAVEESAVPGGVVGFGGIRQSMWHERRIWNLYYRLAPEVWGRGLGTELALAAVAAWRADPRGLPLVAATTSENVPSQRTAMSAGLERRVDLDDRRSDGTLEVAFVLGWDG